MPTSRRLLLIVLTVACAGALLAMPATGAAAFKTKVVVSIKFPAFHGKLTSPSQSCLGQRQVKMFRESNGRKILLGRDRSNAKGKWAAVIARKRVPSGTYYAKAKARGKCKAGTSKRFVIP